MAQTVEVRFKGTRRAFFAWADESAPLRLQEAVIVRAERGEDLGRVATVGAAAAKKCGGSCSCGTTAEGTAAEGTTAEGTTAEGTAAELPPVLRRASPSDLQRHNELRRSEDEHRLRAAAKAREHKLDMKVSDVEWQWDRHRLTVFFTAEQRVDFRTLVRELASEFRTRIDLRQIGVRDEAARLSGVGRCGREYCCSTWLKELSPVSLALAKDQHLSLNPTQISGGCGRLLCCLKYEHEFYAAAKKRFPREGKVVVTLRGAEKVVAVDIFRERVLLRGADETRGIALVDLREEMEKAEAQERPDGAIEGEQRPEQRQGRRQQEQRPEQRQQRGPVRPASNTANSAPTIPASPAVPTSSGVPATPATPASPTPPSGARKRRRRRRRRPGQGGAPGGSPGGA